MKCTLIGKGAVFLGAESSPVPWGGHILRCLSQGTWELSSSSSFPLALLYLHGVSLASACRFCLAAGGFIPLFPVLRDLSHKVTKSHELSSSASGSIPWSHQNLSQEVRREGHSPPLLFFCHSAVLVMGRRWTPLALLSKCQKYSGKKSLAGGKEKEEMSRRT